MSIKPKIHVFFIEGSRNGEPLAIYDFEDILHIMYRDLYLDKYLLTDEMRNNIVSIDWRKVYIP